MVIAHSPAAGARSGLLNKQSCLGIRLGHPDSQNYSLQNGGWIDVFSTIHLGTTTFDLIIAIFKVDVVDV